MDKLLYRPGYEVNPLTMAILAKPVKQGKKMSRILEADAEYVVTKAPTNIIDLSCSFFGSSLRG